MGGLRGAAAAVVGAVALALLSAPGALAFTAAGSVHQVYARDLPGGAKVALLNARRKRVATKTASAEGGVVFRGLKPGGVYRVRPQGAAASGPLTVMSARPAPPSTSIYGQSIPSSGYGYLTTRDGTKLAIDVRPPSNITSVAPKLPAGLKLPDLGGGTHPVLIEYAGYGYADPAGPQSGIAILANLMGFTVVDVNMRGTGCSGGAYDFFEPLQSLDGYDVVETIAHQSWAQGGKVGMMGISYGGISQLFTGQTNPPDLAAISPLSVIDNVQTTLYPGGILNTGFALNWAKERVHDALPASPNGGQAWAYKRIQEGDATCKANQDLHGQAVDLLHKVRANNTYKPKVADPLSPVTFVNKIKAPVFMACQWTDEQTGGHCPTLASRLTGTDRKWITFTNGTHVDSLDPETFNRWYDFLSLYVAKQAPLLNSALIHAAAPLIYSEAMGIDGVTLPPDPIQQQPTYQGALAAFEKLPTIRVLFDNGAGDAPGHPVPGFERSWPSFPVPGTRGRSWYLRAGGALGAKPRTRRGADGFHWNSGARPLADLTGPTDASPGGVWTAAPSYNWTQPSPGRAVSYVSAPLTQGTTVVGGGYVTAWVRSSKRNVDLQATVTEVRPDGKETFVQNGWLRTKERRLDKGKSRPLEPVLSLRKSDARAMPRKRYAKVVIPLYYEGHAYRAGSRIRVTISAPGGDQPIWAFAESSPRKGGASVWIAHSRRRPSRLVLPVVGGDIPTGLPACPGLRGEPCRAYQPFVNRRVRGG